MSNKWELRQDTISSSEDHLTVATFIRRKETDEDWEYTGTLTYYSDGDINLDHSPDWEIS
jgi:hypothetical protein